MTTRSRHSSPTAGLAAAAGSRRAAPQPLVARTQIVEAAEFEAGCLRLLDEVAAGGGEIVITRGGRAVCRLVPVETPKSAPIGRYRDWIDLTGDIVAPVDAEWEAETNPDRVLDPSLPPRSSGNAR